MEFSDSGSWPQLPTAAYPGRWQRRLKCLGSCQAHGRSGFPAPALGLVQPWLLVTFGEWTSRMSCSVLSNKEIVLKIKTSTTAAKRTEDLVDLKTQTPSLSQLLHLQVQLAPQFKNKQKKPCIEYVHTFFLWLLVPKQHSKTVIHTPFTLCWVLQVS